jgi:hypothetical protein
MSKDSLILNPLGILRFKSIGNRFSLRHLLSEGSLFFSSVSWFSATPFRPSHIDKAVAVDGESTERAQIVDGDPD